MRRMLLFVMLLALCLGGLWWGGETLLARAIRQNVQQMSNLQLQEVTPLRRPGRFGLRAQQLTIVSEGHSITLPEVALWAPATALNRLHLVLPRQAEASILGQPHVIGLDQADATVTLAPLNGMAIRQVTAHSGPITLADQALADGVDLDLTLSRLGHGAPRNAATSYDISLDLRGTDLRAFAAAGLPDGQLTVTGRGRVWLDRALTPQALQSGAPPQPVAARIEGADLVLGDLRLRLMGHVLSDDSGRAEGQMMVYTSDAAALLDLAVRQGLLKPGAAEMIGKMLQQLSDDTSGEAPAPAESRPNAGRVAEPAPDAMHFPRPKEGELRLPVTFKGGRTLLGPLPLGPAPQLAGAPPGDA